MIRPDFESMRGFMAQIGCDIDHVSDVLAVVSEPFMAIEKLHEHACLDCCCTFYDYQSPPSLQNFTWDFAMFQLAIAFPRVITF